MTTKKSYTSLGVHKSDLIFKLKNGLQQGTVLASDLFNQYTARLPSLYNLNNETDIKSIFFADIYIVCSFGKNIDKIKLQEALLNIAYFYAT